MNRIGSSDRVREELVAALAEGRGVTAKVRWISRPEDEGRGRWIHATPLLGANGNIGVWMIVLVDEENQRTHRRFRQAPPVAGDISALNGDGRNGDRSTRHASMTRRSGTSEDYPDFGDSPTGVNRSGSERNEYEYMAR